jgi:hypothetical protein
MQEDLKFASVDQALQYLSDFTNQKIVIANDVDTSMIYEIKTYLDNNSKLHDQMTHMRKNLINKKAQGVYDSSKAPKLFAYLVEDAIKAYVEEFNMDQPWHTIMDKPSRDKLAEELTEEFEGEASTGEWDHLLAKKYQNKEGEEELKTE